EVFGGIKGKLSNSVAYNVRTSYGKDENRALFQANYINLLAPGLEGYEFGNSFNVVYDDVNNLSFFAELQVEVSDRFSLGINGTYNNYNTDLQNEAWNLPDLKASIFSNFNITEKLYGGASIFYVGERKDLIQSPQIFGDPILQEITLDGYV